MAGIKNEEKFVFPEAQYWVLMDDGWCVEICGSDHDGDNLVGIQMWELGSRDEWLACGEFVSGQIARLLERCTAGQLDDEEVLNALHAIDFVWKAAG